MNVERLTAADLEKTRITFAVMAEAFEEEDGGPLSDSYLERLLSREDFWALSATLDGRVVGGLTGFTLPLTRKEASEVFLYDIAVLETYRRKGVGRALIVKLRELAAAAGIGTMFVLADNEDDYAIEFYRALGGESAPVTAFNFGE